MNRKVSLMVMVVILVGVTIFAGCGEKAVKKEKITTEKEGEPISDHNHLDNPQWGGAKKTHEIYNIDFEERANLTQGAEFELTALTVTLTWVDDHSGTDSQDVTDPFEVTVIVGNSSFDTGMLNSGNITFTLPNTNITTKDLSASYNGTIRVAIGDCGTYKNAPFIFGRFIRYYDTGNDYTLYVHYKYNEITYKTVKP